MILKKWLTTNEKGTARLTSQRPHMDTDEVSIYIEIEIPTALFRKPTLQAKMKIPEEVAITKEIDAEVTDNIEEAIKTLTGLEMVVSIKNPDEENEN